MNNKTWRAICVGFVCVAAWLAGGHGLAALAEDAPDEAALINVIKGEAGWLEKQTACRALRQKGTVASVPTLAALLTDEQLSHMARYALEPMPYPEAGQALREALGKTAGMPKVGVITSLGVRRDPQAAPLLAPLLSDPAVDVARAAAGALGRIATPQAVEALLSLGSSAPETLRPAVAEGLLVAAERMVEAGQGDLAVTVCQNLLKPDWPMYARTGAFRGLVCAQPNQAPERLLEALRGDEPVFRGMAAQLIAETAGKGTTAVYSAALPALPPEGQVALIRGLADSKDRAAGPAVAKAIASGDTQVKVAAVKALGTLGGADDIALLAGLLVSENPEIAGAAKTSLGTMEGETVDAAMAAIVPKAAAPVRAQVLEVLMNREAGQAVPLAVAGLDDDNMTVRVAGLRVLALRGENAQAPVAVKAVLGAADSDERSAAEKALVAIASRGGEEVLPVVLGAMTGAGPESQIVLLRALARIGGAKALETVLAALDGPDDQVGDEAVRLLSEWPTLDAAPHLRKLAACDDLSRQVLGLRGYVRLARIEPSAEEKARMLTDAMGLAKRPEETRLVVAAWGTLPTGQSLDTLLPHLADAAVRKEAASAIVAVASELGKKSDADKTRAVEALKAVLDACEDKEIRKSTQRALGKLK